MAAKTDAEKLAEFLNANTKGEKAHKGKVAGSRDRKTVDRENAIASKLASAKTFGKIKAAIVSVDDFEGTPNMQTVIRPVLKRVLESDKTWAGAKVESRKLNGEITEFVVTK